MEQTKSPWRFLCLAGAILCALVLLWQIGVWVLLAIALSQAAHWSAPAVDTGSASLGIIGGADGPTAVFVTGAPGFWEYTLPLLALAGLVGCILGYRKLSRPRP